MKKAAERFTVAKKKENMNKTIPLVSIIIPVYNGSNFMREAIDSALNQSYQNVEVLVINDGSHDNGATRTIAESYGNRIRYFEKENGGVSSALNLGIREMQGEYFSWLSHDDLYNPEKIERQVAALEKYSDMDLVCLCGSQHINEVGLPLPGTTKLPFSPKSITLWEDALKQLLCVGTFNGCAFLLPKKLFAQCGSFNEELRYCQDTLMWINIFLAKYNLVYVDYIGVQNRIHPKQVTHTQRGLYIKDASYIAANKLDNFICISSKHQNYLYMQARRMAIRGLDECVALYIKRGKEEKLLSISSVAILKFDLLYGKIRPLLKQIYYRLIRGIAIP